MEANKFATKLHRNTNKIVVILVYAMLEWVLIMLLLFNSMFYYFIKKFASFFGLKPTCLWCSSVDHLFEPEIKEASYEDLFCEAHAAQISKLGYCKSHKKLVEIQNRCQECSSCQLSCCCCEKSSKSDHVEGFVVPKESLRTEEIEEEDNNGDHGEEPQILSDVGSFYLQEVAEEDSSRSTSYSLCNEHEGNEDEGTGGVEIVDARIQVCSLKTESTDFPDESGDASQNDLQAKLKESNCVELEKEEIGGAETSVSCKSDLKKQDLGGGYNEKFIDGSETAANEGLDSHPDGKQNEEASSYPNNGKDEKQSPSNNEKSKTDHGLDPVVAIELLRSELEFERNARRELSAELEAERSAAAIAASHTMAMITRLQEEKAAIKTEALQYQRMMEEQAEYDQEALQLLNELVIKREKEKQELEKELETYKEAKEKAMTVSLNDDSEKLSIDLNCEVGEDQEGENKEIVTNQDISSTGEVLSSVDMVLHRVKNWNMLDGSLEDFEQERLSILHQLKELEEKLFSISDDDDDQEEELPFEDVKPIEENADLCSVEVNLPTTMACAARKLLPMLEQGDGGDEEKKSESDCKVETEDKVLAIMKEMDHVYGRLHALEADREFLRHCISSLNKGDKGVDLLEKILQHLRELRSVDPSELLICQG